MRGYHFRDSPWVGYDKDAPTDVRKAKRRQCDCTALTALANCLHGPYRACELSARTVKSFGTHKTRKPGVTERARYIVPLQGKARAGLPGKSGRDANCAKRRARNARRE